jgi:hypothetical protein
VVAVPKEAEPLDKISNDAEAAAKLVRKIAPVKNLNFVK